MIHRPQPIDDTTDDDIRDRKSETYHPELPVLWVSTSEEKEDLLSGEEEESVGKFIHRSYLYTILCVRPSRIHVVPDHQGTGQGLLHPRL